MKPLDHFYCKLPYTKGYVLNRKLHKTGVDSLPKHDDCCVLLLLRGTRVTWLSYDESYSFIHLDSPYPVTPSLLLAAMNALSQLKCWSLGRRSLFLYRGIFCLFPKFDSWFGEYQGCSELISGYCLKLTLSFTVLTVLGFFSWVVLARRRASSWTVTHEATKAQNSCTMPWVVNERPGKLNL